MDVIAGTRGMGHIQRPAGAALLSLTEYAHLPSHAALRTHPPILTLPSVGRDAFRRDFTPYYSGQQVAAAAAGVPDVAAEGGWDWRRAYRARLQHDANWRGGLLAAPVETLRSHSGWVCPGRPATWGVCCCAGSSAAVPCCPLPHSLPWAHAPAPPRRPVFSSSFLDVPFGRGLAVSAGVVGTEERAELTLWDMGKQLPPLPPLLPPFCLHRRCRRCSSCSSCRCCRHSAYASAASAATAAASILLTPPLLPPLVRKCGPLASMPSALARTSFRCSPAPPLSCHAGRGRYEGVGRLGWQLPADRMANLKGIFHAHQRPGTTQVGRAAAGARLRLGHACSWQPLFAGRAACVV